MKKWISCLLAALLLLGHVIPVQSASEAPKLQTPHACLMELSTGELLYEKAADERLHPASVTKIMTILLIFEAIADGKLSLDQEVVTSAHARSMGDDKYTFC